jgi:hypothetical protein
MNKTTLLLILTLALFLTACSGNASNATGPSFGTQSGTATGELSSPLQVAIGTIKLDGTDNAVTAEQAKELLPLWETLKDLYSSDTAATQEIDALTAQIQETMTAQQTQAITTLNLTRQDMFSVMQSAGTGFGNAQNGNSQNGNSSNNSNRTFNPDGGGFQGPPPGGGFGPGSNANFQGQGSRTQSSNSTSSSNSQTTVNPNRIPTPLVQAVIDFLKKKAG